MSSPGETEIPRIPTTGMRGGLGRTLLTAFLILAIVPLSIVSWYATRRERNDIQAEVTAKLSYAATMTEAQVRQWVNSRIANMALLAALPVTEESTSILVTTDAGGRRCRFGRSRSAFPSLCIGWSW